MRIAVVAGGTGGHIYPALALADALSEKGHEVFYIGNEGKMEEEIVKNKTLYPFLPIHNDGLKPGLVRKIKAILSQFGAIVEAKKLLKQFKIEFVVLFGGYVTFPVAMAAQQLKIPYVIHEQNAIAGKANKVIEKKAKAVITCYDQVKSEFKNPNTVNLGNPRASLVLPSPDSALKEKLNISKSDKLIYIVMGSLGAKTMSELFIEILSEIEFKGVQFVISAGENGVALYQQHQFLKNKVLVFKSVNQLQMLSIADFVISRSGASSVSEIISAHVPSLLIPSPFVVKNHQYYNAKEYADKQAALMIEEKELTKEKLIEAINTVYNTEKLAQMKQQCLALSQHQASEKIIQLIENIYGKN